MKFLVTIEQDEAGYFVVECPALPGCVSQGKTRDEAVANIREAIFISLETRTAKWRRSVERSAQLCSERKESSGCPFHLSLPVKRETSGLRGDLRGGSGHRAC